MSEIDRILAEAIGVQPERYDRCHYTDPPHVCDPGVMPACRGCSEDNWREIVKEYPAYSTDPAMALAWLMELAKHTHVLIYFDKDVTRVCVADPEANVGRADYYPDELQGSGKDLPAALVAAVVEMVEYTPQTAPCRSECCPQPPCDFKGYEKTCRIIPRLRPEIEKLLKEKK